MGNISLKTKFTRCLAFMISLLMIESIVITNYAYAVNGNGGGGGTSHTGSSGKYTWTDAQQGIRITIVDKILTKSTGTDEQYMNKYVKKSNRKRK